MDIFNQHRALLPAQITVTGRRVTVAMALLWLAVAGGGWGFTKAPVVLINMGLGLAVIWAAKQPTPKPSQAPAVFALLPIIAALLISTMVNRAWAYGPIKLMMWLGFLAVLMLAQESDTTPFHRAALWVLLIYTLPALLIRWDNDNTAASNILFLGLLAWPAVKPPLNPPQRGGGAFVLPPLGGVRGGILFSILLLSMLILQCLAGLLALLAAVFALANIPHKKTLFAGLLGLGLLLGWWISPGSYQWRLIFWSDALAAAWSHPWGIGPGNYWLLNNWPHAHNVALNLIAENGLPGLLAVLSSLIFLAMAWRNAAHRPPWAVATLAAFGLWSLLDTPTQVLLPPTIAMVALSTLTRETSLTH